MDLILTNNTLTFNGQSFKHAIGAGGVKFDKHEGDMATPVGSFPFRRAFYRGDRLAKPLTPLPLKALEPTDGWCDDVDDPKYNQYVKLPYKGRHEQLYREDEVYDLILVVGHNDAPIVKGAGSCIFVHLARPTFTPTYGCVAFTLENLLQVLKDCTLESRLIVNL